MNLKFISLVMLVCVSSLVQSSQRKVSFDLSHEVEKLSEQNKVGRLIKKEHWADQLEEEGVGSKDSDVSVSPLLKNDHISSLKEALALKEDRLGVVAFSGLFLTVASFISSAVRFYDDCYKAEQVQDVCYQKDPEVCARSQNIFVQQLGIIGLYTTALYITNLENKPENK